ncbi:hypothetical protein, partial [Amycolatopsis deserti]|uniref:hypothetical protein n=1 Tax=Amycolatopsis deserti TaxID=185696 RepID=UPI001E28B703
HVVSPGVADLPDQPNGVSPHVTAYPPKSRHSRAVSVRTSGRHRARGRHRVQPTFTRWRILFLALAFPVAFIGTGLVIQAGGNVWTLPGAAAPDWAPTGDNTSVIRCVGDCR